MRPEPAFDREALLATIRTAYGISARSLAFVPSGEYATGYALEADSGRYFLKIWPRPLPGYLNDEATIAMLRLTRSMYERGVVSSVVYPLPAAKGSLSVMFAGRRLALFPFIEGKTPVASAQFAAELGRNVAELHAVTPALSNITPRRELLDIPFADFLRQGLASIADVGLAGRPVFRALRERIEPHRLAILEFLLRLERLQERVAKIGAPFVVCHRDLGVWNALVDDLGRLRIIDWDDVSLAPPEHDLFGGRGPWFDDFLNAYASAGGTRPLHADHLAFVLWRRIVDDMHWRLRRLLRDDCSAEEAAHQMDGMDRWVLPEWNNRERTADEAIASLRASGLAAK